MHRTSRSSHTPRLNFRHVNSTALFRNFRHGRSHFPKKKSEFESYVWYPTYQLDTTFLLLTLNNMTKRHSCMFSCSSPLVSHDLQQQTVADHLTPNASEILRLGETRALMYVHACHWVTKVPLAMVMMSSTVELVDLLDVEEVSLFLSIILHFCGIIMGTFCSSA